MFEKPKICLVTHLYPRDEQDYKGVFVAALAVELANRGYEVHVITPMRPGAVQEERRKGIHVHRYTYWGWHMGKQLGELTGTSLLLLGTLLMGGLFKCLKSIFKYHLNLIHAYWVVPGGLIGMMAGQLTGLPVVATAAGSDLNLAPRSKSIRPLVRLTLKNLDKLIAVSTWLKQKALELGSPREKCTVIPGPVGVDLPELAISETKVALERKCAHCLVYVGNLTPPRRADIVIRAVARVIETLPECQLILVGDGYLRPSLEALTKDLGIEDHVLFRGAVPHVQVLGILLNADLFVHCSDEEGLGVAIMEAMGAGLPVVASRVGGVSDLVRDGETGLMVSPDDVRGYAEGILSLLTNDQLRRQLGANGRRFAEQYLDKQIILSHLEKVYDELLHLREYSSVS